MQLSLDFLRDGYQLRPDGPGKWWVAVRLANGGTGRSVDVHELESRGARVIAEEIRRQNEQAGTVSILHGTK